MIKFKSEPDILEPICVISTVKKSSSNIFIVVDIVVFNESSNINTSVYVVSPFDVLFIRIFKIVIITLSYYQSHL